MQWNGLEFFERVAEPKSPDWTFHPGGESRLNALYWIDWDHLVSADGTAPPFAQKALCGFARAISDHTNGKFISYSPELVVDAGGGETGGFLPHPYPSHPAGFYLAESFQRVGGDVPLGILPGGGADFDEANVAVGYRCPPNGFRALTDTTVKTPLAAVNPVAEGGDGLPLPNVGVPNEYYLARFCEVEENFSTKAQSLPPGPAGGLVWIDSPATGVPPRRPAASAATYIPLSHAEYRITWGPVPIDSYNHAAMNALVNKTNANPFPPTPPVGCPPQMVMSQKPRGTLVWQQPVKKAVRMGDCNFAYIVTLRILWYPSGANGFYRWDRPIAEGGPGFARVAREDGGLLFPYADYPPAFVAP